MHHLFRSLLALAFIHATAIASLAAEPLSADDLKKRAAEVLSPISGELSVPGLSQRVEVLRDRWGVPHIYAQNVDDLFFAQGFVVAQDRLFQLDIWRRVAVGETAAVLGERGVAGDKFSRLMLYRGDMNAEWESYSPDAKRIVTAFVRGINACIDQSLDRLPIEFQLLGYKPAKWQPQDVLGRMSGLIMCRNMASELLRAEVISAVGVEKARQLMPTDPMREFAPVPGLELDGLTRSILAGYEAASKPLNFEADGGSNNWVISSKLSASGKPMLAGDPHRALLLPSLRYLVHLNAPGWDVIGAGEPALPGVALGHNQHMAWALTIVGTDQEDLYVEETKPDDPTQYRVGDGWQPMQIIREKVIVRGKEQPTDVELRFTRHGAVIHQDQKRNKAYALRWVGHEPGSAAYLASLRLGQADTKEKFVSSLAHWNVPALNIAYAHRDGHIGWVAAGLTPIRKGWDGLLPVPGAHGKYEWNGFRPLAGLPQSHDPERGYIATANHNILPPDYKHEVSYEWAAPYRFKVIQQRLNAQSQFTLEDFRSIQQEATTLPGQQLVKLLKHVDAKPLDAVCVKLLSTWDGVLSKDSRAAVLYGYLMQELLDNFFKASAPEKLRDSLRGNTGVEVMLAALATPTGDWFESPAEQSRNELLTKSLAKAIDRAKERFPGYPEKGTWGELHVAPYEHPLAKRSKEIAKAFSLDSVGKAGDGFTPNAASHNRNFQQTAGASYRQLFDLDDWDRGLATSAPGQSGQPGSPHYSDLLPLWADGNYFPLAYSRAKVESVTKNRLVLVPAMKEK